MAKGLAVVTGASKGIGFELARDLVRRDHDVVLIADGDDVHVAARQVQGVLTKPRD